MKSSARGLSREWKVERQYRTAYTGGKVEVSTDGRFVACQCEGGVSFLDIESGSVSAQLKEFDTTIADEEIVTFALNPCRNELMTASRNLMIRIWDLDAKACVKMWKGHRLPIISASYDSTGTLVATGGSDRVVMVWDATKGHCTHSFRGHKGIVTTVRFHPDPNRLMLFSSSDDSNVCVWDLVAHKCVATLDSHMSVVTSIAFSPDGWTLLSAGRDKIINVWELRTYKKLKTVPVYESLEDVQIVGRPVMKKDSKEQRSRDLKFVTVGERGTFREWDLFATTSESENIVRYTCREGRKMKREEGVDVSPVPYVALLKRAADFVAVTADHRFIVVGIDGNEWSQRKQIVGYNDEIFDLKYVPRRASASSIDDSSEKNASFVMATNSADLRLVNSATFDSVPLCGHSDMVLAVSASPCGRFVASASKDNTCRIWETSTGRCRVACVGHTDAVGAVALPRLVTSFTRASAWVLTASKDKTIKAWCLKSSLFDISEADDEKEVPTTIVRAKTLATQMAHDKDINAVAVAPNDRLVATASQDKTVKLWTMDPSASAYLAPAGTLRGHRRGVWSVQFSPVDRCIVTGSADRTVRLWSVEDKSCIGTFEGHTASVLRVHFIRMGMQLMSAGADGLIKLWTVRSSECTNTFEGHDSKIWAMAMSADGTQFVSGGSDSTLRVWSDITSEVEDERIAKKESEILQEQKLRNLSRSGKHVDAALLALELERPGHLQTLLRKAVDDDGAAGSGETLRDFVRGVLKASKSDDQQKKMSLVRRLVEYASHWNRNSKGSVIAQRVLEWVFRIVDVESLKFLCKIKVGDESSDATLLDVLASYSDRHYRRFNRLLEASFVIDYALHSMGNLSDAPPAEAGSERTEKRKIDAVHDNGTRASPRRQPKKAKSK